MKAKELRIGNYVEYTNDGVIFSITEISEAGIGIKNRTEETWIELDEFSPIPLTEDWLIKFGFEKDNDSFYYYPYKAMFFSVAFEPELMVGICRKGDVSFYDRYEHIKYIHQLQNLIYILTGEELSIVEK